MQNRADRWLDTLCFSTFFKDSLVPTLVAKGMKELENGEVGRGTKSAREVYDEVSPVSISWFSSSIH